MGDIILLMGVFLALTPGVMSRFVAGVAFLVAILDDGVRAPRFFFVDGGKALLLLSNPTPVRKNKRSGA